VRGEEARGAAAGAREALARSVADGARARGAAARTWLDAARAAPLAPPRAAAEALPEAARLTPLQLQLLACRADAEAHADAAALLLEAAGLASDRPFARLPMDRWAARVANAHKTAFMAARKADAVEARVRGRAAAGGAAAAAAAARAPAGGAPAAPALAPRMDVDPLNPFGIIAPVLPRASPIPQASGFKWG
jgi:hypothetical protein